MENKIPKKHLTYYNIPVIILFSYIQLFSVIILTASSINSSDISSIHIKYFWYLLPIIGVIATSHLLLMTHLKFYEAYFTPYTLLGKRTYQIPYEKVAKYAVVDIEDRNGKIFKNVYFKTIDNQEFEVGEGMLINKGEVERIQNLVAQKAKIDTGLGSQMENWGSIKTGLILISFGLAICSFNYYASKDVLDWTPHSANDIKIIQGTVTYFNKQNLGRGSYLYDFSLKEYPNFIFRIEGAVSSILSQDSSLHPIQVSNVIQVGIGKKDYNIKIVHTQAQDWWDYIHKYEYIDICTLSSANRSYIELAAYNKYNMEYSSSSGIGVLWMIEKLFLIQGIGIVLFQCFSIVRGNKKVSVA